MAGFGREGKALLPLRYVANLFKDQTIAQLQNNFMTQRIWPYEVYPGYHVDNERRRLEGGWFATGEGVKSFSGDVVEADEQTGTVTLSSTGQSHRPAIAMEFRHLATRLENYVQDFYCKTAEFQILETYEGLTIYV